MKHLILLPRLHTVYIEQQSIDVSITLQHSTGYHYVEPRYPIMKLYSFKTLELILRTPSIVRETIVTLFTCGKNLISGWGI